MKGKVLFVVGLGVGYVLGTRAGRQRYEQIKEAAESVWNTPTVQSGVTTVKDFAMARVGDVSDTVLDGVKNLIGTATKGSGATRQDVKSAARSAKSNVTKAADAARDAIDDTAAKLESAIDDASDIAAESAAPKKAAPKKAAPKSAASKPRTSKSGS
ncbi:type IV secretory pathway TrbL component [Agromyces terreus]|uniref:Type IV secretory pathway TrbL component n=1 Tax=Agromyces terreus TaxID=424795 RepID=A0A9X2KE33_9MICO|nr:hypothetical protein [Agromyces terreus]MCP2370212.1 type IV secretory pathway TrbL component [Agromyces terreus]